MKNYELNEYEAALVFDMSPTLLRWMTVNGVVDKTKLSFEERNEIYYYDKEELHRLNLKMAGKWPKNSKGKRPNIPEGIKREIKHEARNACPACNKSYGEIAHIDSVAATHCNHPKNLIFLCPDHHTEYDNARIPKSIDRDEVITLKNSLKIFQRQLWKIQGNTINTYLSGLNSAKSLLAVHNVIKLVVPESEYRDTLEKIAKSTEKASGKVINRSNFGSASFLDREVTKYIDQNKENLCPLCHGLGSTNFYDPCPVCLGDGEVKPGTRNQIDLSPFELVECRLCDGVGVYENMDCPACNSEGKVSQFFDDYHDWSMHDLVDCKLCNGLGVHESDDCPACHGEGEVTKHFADNHDWSMHDLVDCKLCNGDGLHDSDDCPACHGEGEVTKHFADNHDWSMHDLVDCKLCNGDGLHESDDCPACHGEGKLIKHVADNHDWSAYEHVTCQLCKGEGRYHAEKCEPCHGEGRVTREFNYEHDWHQYQ